MVSTTATSASTSAATTAFGGQLRKWRQHRRLSQEALAFDAEISTRHLSFLEGGKAKPSREMVLILASALEVPLRERNVLLQAAGFAAVYKETGLDDAAMDTVRRALDLLLEQQEPWGAVVVDRVWNVTRLNRGAERLFAHFPPTSTDPRVVMNVVRTLFHPGGLRPFIVNIEEVATSTLERLHREIALAPDDETLLELQREVAAYDDVAAALAAPKPLSPPPSPVLAVHLRKGDDEVRLMTLLTTLGTPLDVSAQELAIESYFPADAASEAFLRRLSRE